MFYNKCLNTFFTNKEQQINKMAVDTQYMCLNPHQDPVITDIGAFKVLLVHSSE